MIPGVNILFKTIKAQKINVNGSADAVLKLGVKDIMTIQKCQSCKISVTDLKNLCILPENSAEYLRFRRERC